MHLSKKERYEQELDPIDWTLYSTAYGPAVDVPRQLLALRFGTTEEAMKSAHDLWAGLCHQHAYISSAALPSYPFLIQVLESADEELAI